MWAVYAGLSALFAAATAILLKLGLKDASVSASLANAIRIIPALLAAWIIVAFTGQYKEISGITPKIFLWLILSGLATGLSWLFYTKAIQMGEVSKVAPIDKLSVVITMLLAFVILGETPDFKTLLAGALITAGTFVLIM